MQAASAAGMPGIGVASGSATAEELAEAGASFMVKELTELIPFARGLASESGDDLSPSAPLTLSVADIRS
jgi:hypothetical protein